MTTGRLHPKQKIFPFKLHQIILVAALGLAACTADKAQATIIAQDDLSYRSTLYGQNGGSDWAVAWTPLDPGLTKADYNVQPAAAAFISSAPDLQGMSASKPSPLLLFGIGLALLVFGTVSKLLRA